MRKPREVKSERVFMGKFWICHDPATNILTIMPRRHYASMDGRPARIEIISYTSLSVSLFGGKP